MKKTIISVISSGVISLEIFIIFALSVHLKNYFAQLFMLSAVFIVSFISFILLDKSLKIFKGFKALTAVLIIPLLVSICFSVSLYAVKSNLVRFQHVDDGKSALFADKKVMVIVPHQDDETLLFGGLFEQYVRYGSDVDVVFSTNGDAAENENTKCTRLKEAIKALDSFGIDEENITFLGYGDTWENGKDHIYLADGNELMTSSAGYKNTYGLPEHPAYNNGAQYTRNNLKQDIKNVVKEKQPQIIYCVDYDKNCDHRSTSLIFEEAMGELLAENSGYRPIVYKGFAYSTSMYAPMDYNSRNVLSTVNPYSSNYMQETNVYNWNERVRFPVADDSLSRLFDGTSVYDALSCHKSQSVFRFAQGAANGDKVFWERRTDSLLYNAKITCGNQNTVILNDFKITDSTNVLEQNSAPNNGDGVFLTNDAISVTLPSAVKMDRIVLYDNPSVDDNITNAVITFDNGTSIGTGELEKNGSGTEICFDEQSVKSFTISFDSWIGKKTGLTEIEAFDGENDNDLRYLKIMDKEENFVYDYYMESDTQEFLLYSIGDCGNLTVSTDNSQCSAELDGEKISVKCPKGLKCKVTVSGDGVSDTVIISHPVCFVKQDIAIMADNFYWKTLRWWNQKYYYVEIKKMLF